MVRELPASACLVSKELMASEEEKRPAIEPTVRLRTPIRRRQNIDDMRSSSDQILVPMKSRLRVMAPRERQGSLDRKRNLEMVENIVGRHHPPGKEMSAHPVIFTLSLVRVEKFRVREDMQK